MEGGTQGQQHSRGGSTVPKSREVLTHQHHLSRKTGTAWWGDFSELQIQIKQKSQFEFVPQETSEFKHNQNLDSTLYREIPRNLIFLIVPS